MIHELHGSAIVFLELQFGLPKPFGQSVRNIGKFSNPSDLPVEGTINKSLGVRGVILFEFSKEFFEAALRISYLRSLSAQKS
jgi:hypothetical protein